MIFIAGSVTTLLVANQTPPSGAAPGRIPGLYSVADFDDGTAWDGTRNKTAAIQAAIDAASAHGGGEVVMPPGIAAITATIRITTPGVRLRALGPVIAGPWNENLHQAGFSTTLRWTGPPGGTMVYVGPPNNDALRIESVQFEGVYLDAQSRAAVALKVGSVRYGVFSIGFRNPTVAGVMLDSLPLRRNGADLQNCRFDLVGVIEPASATADGVVLNGNGAGDGGNVSMNRFDRVAVTNFGQGWGLRLDRTDNNLFAFVNVNALKVGRMSADNHFYYVTGVNRAENFVVEAGSAGNRFEALDTGNGVANPTIAAGAEAFVWSRALMSFPNLYWTPERLSAPRLVTTRALTQPTGFEFHNVGGTSLSNPFDGISMFSPPIVVGGTSFTPVYGEQFKFSTKADPSVRRWEQHIGGINPAGGHELEWWWRNDTATPTAGGFHWGFANATLPDGDAMRLDFNGNLTVRGALRYAGAEIIADRLKLVASTGGRVRVPRGARVVQILGPDAVQGFTIELPGAGESEDGQVLHVISGGAVVTGLALVAGDGRKAAWAPEMISPRAPFTLLWDAASATWLRLQ